MNEILIWEAPILIESNFEETEGGVVPDTWEGYSGSNEVPPPPGVS